MELEMSPNSITVRLSRRNIESLLAKLNGYPANSARTLIREYGEVELIVVAEEDAAHYGERQPGEMHIATEGAIGHG